MYQIMFKSPLKAAKINIGEEKDWTGAFSFYSSNDISPDRIEFGLWISRPKRIGTVLFRSREISLLNFHLLSHTDKLSLQR